MTLSRLTYNLLVDRVKQFLKTSHKVELLKYVPYVTFSDGDLKSTPAWGLPPSLSKEAWEEIQVKRLTHGEHVGQQATIGFSFANDWHRGGLEFSGTITEYNRAKPMQSWNAFKTHSNWWKHHAKDHYLYFPSKTLEFCVEHRLHVSVCWPALLMQLFFSSPQKTSSSKCFLLHVKKKVKVNTCIHKTTEDEKTKFLCCT